MVNWHPVEPFGTASKKVLVDADNNKHCESLMCWILWPWIISVGGIPQWFMGDIQDCANRSFGTRVAIYQGIMYICFTSFLLFLLHFFVLHLAAKISLCFQYEEIQSISTLTYCSFFIQRGWFLKSVFTLKKRENDICCLNTPEIMEM